MEYTENNPYIKAAKVWEEGYKKGCKDFVVTDVEAIQYLYNLQDNLKDVKSRLSTKKMSSYTDELLDSLEVLIRFVASRIK